MNSFYSDMQGKKISIIIPCYNQAEYVESITGYKSDDKIIPRVVTEDDINLQIEFAEVSFKIEVIQGRQSLIFFATSSCRKAL